MYYLMVYMSCIQYFYDAMYLHYIIYSKLVVYINIFQYISDSHYLMSLCL